MACCSRASRHPVALARKPRVARSLTSENSAATKKPFRMMKRAARPSPNMNLDLLDASLPEQTGRLEQEDQNEHDEDEDVLAARVITQFDQFTDDPDQPATEERSLDAAN